MGTNPSVAVYGIYKNEEKFVARFLNSAKDADEIVLCDTGSDDNTNAIIDTYKQNNPDAAIKTYKICVSPWRFDDARNTAMALIGADIDLCIVMDMDEYLMEGWRDVLAASYDPKYTCYYHKYETISSGNKSYIWRDRIHTRRGFLCQLPVHEVLASFVEVSICRMHDFWMHHEPDASKPRTMYFPLLEQSAKERPDVWRTWSGLANEYYVTGRYEEMDVALDKALTLEGANIGFLHMCKFLMYQRQNKQDLALLSLNNYILHKSSRREPYFLKAEYLHRLGRNIEAYFSLLDAQRHVNKIHDYEYNAGCWGDHFNSFMAKVKEAAKKEGLAHE